MPASSDNTPAAGTARPAAAGAHGAGRVHVVVCDDGESVGSGTADAVAGTDDDGARVTVLQGRGAAADLVELLGSPDGADRVDLVVIALGSLETPGHLGVADDVVGAAVRAHLDAGGGLLATRASLRSCERWPPWSDVTGALWDPDVAGTAPTGEFVVEPVGDAHPVVDGVEPFVVVDAPPVFVDVRPDVGVLASVRWNGRVHPVWWAHAVGAGRVVYDGLGADPHAPLTSPRRTMLTRAARWCTRNAQPDTAGDPQYELELRTEDVAAWTRAVSRDPCPPPG